MVELRQVTKQFGTATVLHNINLQIPEGEFLTLLGPSGCGKTTLLRIIAGFVEPTSGDAILAGQNLNGVPPNKRQVGMLFQNYALFPHMTVEGNVSFGLRMRGENKEHRNRKVGQALQLVGMEGFAGRYPAQLSGGQQQRVALARTLVIEPRVLLLDEPMAALDRKLRREMQLELKRIIARLGITTICVTHDQDEALTMSDRIAVMNCGRIEQLDSPLGLYDRPLTPFVARFIGNANLLSGSMHRDFEGRVSFMSDQLRVELPGWEAEPLKNAVLLLRSEHLRLTAEPDANALRGGVTFVVQLGHATQYEIQLDGGPTVLASMHRNQEMPSFRAGDRVYVGLNSPSAYHVIES